MTVGDMRELLAHLPEEMELIMEQDDGKWVSVTGTEELSLPVLDEKEKEYFEGILLLTGISIEQENEDDLPDGINSKPELN